MTFEYLTAEEVAEHGLSPEEAAWEEAARKREAIQRQALAERIQEVTAKVQENTRKMERILANSEARRERLWAQAARLGGGTPRPQLVLIRGEKDEDDA